MTEGLFRKPWKCSAQRSKIIMTVIRIVPSALRRGLHLKVWVHTLPLTNCRSSSYRACQRIIESRQLCCSAMCLASGRVLAVRFDVHCCTTALWRCTLYSWGRICRADISPPATAWSLHTCRRTSLGAFCFQLLQLAAPWTSTRWSQYLCFQRDQPQAPIKRLFCVATV